jgi:hypothetical protein
MHWTRSLRAILQNIKHEFLAVNAAIKSIVDKVIQAGVLSALAARLSFTVHDITPY